MRTLNSKRKTRRTYYYLRLAEGTVCGDAEHPCEAIRIYKKYLKLMKYSNIAELDYSYNQTIAEDK